jgi:hypothetical protein
VTYSPVYLFVTYRQGEDAPNVVLPASATAPAAAVRQMAELEELRLSVARSGSEDEEADEGPALPLSEHQVSQAHSFRAFPS